MGCGSIGKRYGCRNVYYYVYDVDITTIANINYCIVLVIVTHYVHDYCHPLAINIYNVIQYVHLFT